MASTLKVYLSNIMNSLGARLSTTPGYPFSFPFLVSTIPPGGTAQVDLSAYTRLEADTALQAIEITGHGEMFSAVTGSVEDGWIEISLSPSATTGQFDTIHYRIQDDEGRWSLPALISVIAAVGSTPPVVADAAFLVSPGASLPVNFASLITPGSRPVVSTTITGSHPAILVEVTGATTALITALPSFSGVASLSFFVTDSAGLASNIGALTVADANVAPVVLNKTATGPAGSTRVVNPYLGAADANGNLGPPSAANVEVTQTPEEAEVTIAADGQFSIVLGPTVGSDAFTYRIRDLSGAWSNEGSVSLTIVAANQPPVTIPASTTAVIGSFVDISLADLTSDPEGSTLTYSVTTPPANGSVVLSGAGGFSARYTPNPATEETSDSFVFRATDPGGLWSASTITLALLAVPLYPKYIPLQTILWAWNGAADRGTGSGKTEANAKTLTNALNALNGAGGTIFLADGLYTGDRVISQSGLSTKWLCIVSAKRRGARFSGHWNCTGNWQWFSGLTAERPGSNPGVNTTAAFETASFYSWRLAGQHQRVTNCRIDSPNGVWIDCDAGFSTRYIDVCYNDITGRTTPRWNQSNGIYMGRFAENSAGCLDVMVARNRFYNDLAFTDENVLGVGDQRHCLYTGNSKPGDNNVGNNRAVRILENVATVNYIGRGFHTKRGYEVGRNFVQVNAAGAGVYAFNLRHGGYSQNDGTVFASLTDAKRAYIWGNNFDKGAVLAQDTDHLWNGNRFGGKIMLSAGGWVPTGSPLYANAASRNIFVANRFGGSVEVGAFDAAQTLNVDHGGKARENQIYPAGVGNQPTVANGRLIVSAALADVDTAWQVSAGDGGYTPIPNVTLAELSSVVGCDAAGAVEIGIPDSEDPGGGDTGELTTPLRTLKADTPAELTTILNTASGDFPAAITITGSADRSAPYRAGDMIELDNGAYNSVTISRSGTDANPIWVKAKNKGAVTANGVWTLSGNNVRIWGINFSGPDIGLRLNGNKTRAYRCKFSGLETVATKAGGDMCVSYAGDDCGILYCELYDIDGRGFSGKSDKLRPLVYRCHFHNWANPKAGSSGNARECIQLGQTQVSASGDGAPVRIEQRGRVLYNLFKDNYNSSPGAGERAHDENEPLSIKSSKDEIRGNTFIASKNCNGRFGNDSVFAQNYIGAGSQLAVYGDRHALLANNCSAGNYISVNAGNQYMDASKTSADHVAAGLPPSQIWNGSSDYPAARNVRCAGNSGELRIGDVPGGGEVAAPTKNTVIEGHTGTIKTQANYAGSWDTPTGGYRETGTTYSATDTSGLTAPSSALTGSDVGPDADWIDIPATLLT